MRFLMGTLIFLGKHTEKMIAGAITMKKTFCRAPSTHNPRFNGLIWPT